MSAAEWIGASKWEADRLDVVAIAASLPPEALALKTILSDPMITGADRMRRIAADDARNAKQMAQWLSIAVIVASAVAALASGILLYGQGGADAPASQSLVNLATRNIAAITVVQVLALFVASASAAYLAGMNFAKRWTQSRQEAESGRIKIFNKALELAAVESGMGPDSALRQVIEFFRRYQLDLQIGYYQKASKREVKNSGKALLMTSILGGVTVVLGLLHSISPTLLFVAAFLGIGVPILLSAVQSWSASSGATEKAGSYAAAWKALEGLRLDLTRVQAAADSGDVEEVKKFIDGVHGVISAENGAFVGAAALPAAPAPTVNQG